MKTSVAVVLLMMVVCIAVVCESAAVSKQRRADDGLTRWLPGLMINRRHFIPPAKHVVAAQKRRKTVRIKPLIEQTANS